MGRVTCVGGELPTEFWFGKPKERNQFEDRGVDGRIIF